MRRIACLLIAFGTSAATKMAATEPVKFLTLKRSTSG